MPSKPAPARPCCSAMRPWTAAKSATERAGCRERSPRIPHDRLAFHMSTDIHHPLSYEEHRELGGEMKRTRLRLEQLSGLVSGVYGQQSLPSVQFVQVNDAL